VEHFKGGNQEEGRAGMLWEDIREHLTQSFGGNDRWIGSEKVYLEDTDFRLKLNKKKKRGVGKLARRRQGKRVLYREGSMCQDKEMSAQLS
jgi:hypothetical protein